MTNQKRIDDIRKALDSGYLYLNDWEQGFIDNTYNKFILPGKELTWPHQKKLIEIWEKIE